MKNLTIGDVKLDLDPKVKVKSNIVIVNSPLVTYFLRLDRHSNVLTTNTRNTIQ